MTDPSATISFLRAATGSFGGPSPYRSDSDEPAWPLAFYGMGTRRGNYRATLFLDENGTYSHLLMQPNGEMEVQKTEPHSNGAEALLLYPSLFVDTVVALENGEFRPVRAAAGRNGPEGLVDVLTRSLAMISSGALPPIFDFQQRVSSP